MIIANNMGVILGTPLLATYALLCVMLLIYTTIPLVVGQPSNSISIVAGASSATSPRFYDPSPSNISIGTSVIWTNNDNSPHTVTSRIPYSGPLAVFDSNLIQPHGTFSYTFTSSGIFNYYCKIHPFMNGQVIVR
jgi:plastocyanin